MTGEVRTVWAVYGGKDCGAGELLAWRGTANRWWIMAAVVLGLMNWLVWNVMTLKVI